MTTQDQDLEKSSIMTTQDQGVRIAKRGNDVDKGGQYIFDGPPWIWLEKDGRFTCIWYVKDSDHDNCSCMELSVAQYHMVGKDGPHWHTGWRDHRDGWEGGIIDWDHVHQKPRE